MLLFCIFLLFRSREDPKDKNVNKFIKKIKVIEAITFGPASLSISGT